MEKLIPIILTALSWFFGVIFLITGSVALFQESVFVGLLMIVGALLLLPPIKELLINKQPKLSKGILSLIGSILIIISISNFSPAEELSEIDGSSKVEASDNNKSNNEDESTNKSQNLENKPVEKIKENNVQTHEEGLDKDASIDENIEEPIVVDTKTNSNTSGKNDEEELAIAKEKACKNISSTAESIMMARQSGRSINEVMGIADQAGNPMAEQIVRAFVKDAYNIPLQDTSEKKKSIAVEFGNVAYLECSKAFKI